MNVSGVSSTGHPQHEKEPRRPNDVLDKHDFLRLLTVQLRYQDPMDPIKDQDFIAQLAQFTSLEQMQNLTNKMETFIDLQLNQAATTQAAALLGKTVAVYDDATGESIVGVVESVRFDLGVPLLVIEGKSFTLADVYEIRS